MTTQRNSYSFKEGLTMMAAKAVGIDPYLAAEGGENARAAINAIRNAAKTKTPKDRVGFIREAQAELRSISAAQHPKLVNALQARVLALQGRGGDTQVAHVTPGEMVLPRAMLTPEVLRMISAEAQLRGIDPRQLLVGKGPINPATGTEEHWSLSDIGDTVRGWFGDNKDDQLDISGVGPVSVTRRDSGLSDGGHLDVDSIPVTATWRSEALVDPIVVSSRRMEQPQLPSIFGRNDGDKEIYDRLERQFQEAQLSNDPVTMRNSYEELRKRVLPSGLSYEEGKLPREAMNYPQAMADLARIQGLETDALYRGERDKYNSVQDAFKQRGNIDDNHMVGHDGQVYWRPKDGQFGDDPYLDATRRMQVEVTRAEIKDGDMPKAVAQRLLQQSFRDSRYKGNLRTE